MFNATLRRSLVLLSALVLPLTTQAASSAPSAPPALKAKTVLTDLDGRLDELQSQLNTVRDAQGEAQRQGAMEQHWKEMQDYMAASLGMVVGKSGGAEGCRVVSGTWSGLAFPGQIRSDDYLKAMQARLGKMREDLVGLHAAANDPAALNTALQTHWQSNYQFLQGMRGLDWMFSGWTPASPGDQTLPDPRSAGAQTMQAYCSLCHAVPNTRLHTAEEWAAVMPTMARHITTSDSGFPVCVQVPTADELKAISDYLVKYAR
ncbi:hypothetical protein E4T66_06270 [Sinimarinibacterium sp. CAU 1509]|uniref:hypothetical protein n=1 Tax=Sinimarinibacterium sp. CAU 1509 TaxID=2562283 RepID=UPI0010AC3A97|nr:hypothetical protein [Sinimarinibacterium sp. CAU 1509]TJY63300.1 hypothetical protein E4T66_06270 [Sinimarinibacterium sp. CAU 1509]